MARTRPGLAKAVEEILERHGANGRRLSLRQAERRTGLSPATIGELAKGNARTTDTVRRFAEGMGETVDQLLLLAGFTPDALDPSPVILPDAPPAQPPSGTQEAAEADVVARLDPASCALLERLARALHHLPSCREREIVLERLRWDTELIEQIDAARAKRVNHQT